MTRRHIPQDVLDAAHARSAARAGGDWAEADRLRTEIEAAGWKVVDRGTDFALSPFAPPDEVDGGRVRYGSSASVPSRAHDPDAGVATVVLIATDRPDDFARTLAGVRAGAPAGTSIVIVADGPSDEQAAALEAMPADDATEIVWTSERLGRAAATNVGLRRCSGPIVVLLDTTVEPLGDVVTPLALALDDSAVAIVGGWGLTSRDMRTFIAASTGGVDVIDWACQAFRRASAIACGPLDERFVTASSLAIWWSFVLRDEGETEPARRAVLVEDLPVTRREAPSHSSGDSAERERLGKRDRYRILDRFGRRADLLSGG